MVTVTEIIPVEGIDTSGTPPCQILIVVLNVFRHECGMPSAARIYSKCICGARCTIFICAPHRDDAAARRTTCLHCQGPVGITGYR